MGKQYSLGSSNRAQTSPTNFSIQPLQMRRQIDISRQRFALVPKSHVSLVIPRIQYRGLLGVPLIVLCQRPRQREPCRLRVSLDRRGGFG